ncbi:MAG: ABC transporter permease [Bdellovibrionaceae bacterium]|jgi:ABC-2 type transport system permease protein|nr:ABC transporter permease [Pseudobdellovibrionaceae bacterium]
MNSPAKPFVSQELTWTPFFSLLKREVQRFLKVAVQTLLAPMINSGLYLLIFGLSLGSRIQISDGTSYLSFLIPGLIMMGCLNNAFSNSSSSVVGSKYGGELEDYKAAPLSSQQIIWAISLGGLFRGLLVGLVTFIVGEAFLYFQNGEFLSIQHPVLLVFFLTVGGLSFAKLGLSAAFWAKSFDHLAAFGTFILMPLIYLGGVFYSLEHLSPFWQTLTQFNPLFYFINGVRYSILGASDVNVWMAFGISLIMLLLFHGFALFSLKGGSFNRW